jgi:1,4-dihydroxy-2-naphthoate octaprenyltransferase
MTPSRLSIWIEAARPKTLWAAVAPVVIGTALACDEGGFASLPAIAALVGAILIQIGTNFANDYYDFTKGADEGERLGPTRATQAGLVAPESMKRATMIAFALAIGVGVYLVYVGGWPIVTIGLLSVFFGVIYTAGPFALGYKGLADLFVLLFFGPVAVGGTYYVQTLTITPEVLILGLAPGLLSVALLTVNNLRDIDNDRQSGKRTLAVRCGQRFAQGEFVACLVLACFIPTIVHWYRGGHPFIQLMPLLLLGSIPALKILFGYTDGRQLNQVLAATGKLLIFQAVLFSILWLL